MNADDDGFVKNPKRIQKMLGANEDDSKLLIAKAFVLPFDSGVIVIKHWRMHNLLRKDRYKATEYTEEKALLYLKENGAYTFDQTQGKPLLEANNIDTINDLGNQKATNGIPNGNQMAPQVSIGKVSIGKDSIEKKKEYKEKNGPETEPCPVVGGQTTSSPSTVKRFVKPSVKDIKAYCTEASINIDAQRFFDFYESKGWKVGSSPMKDWKAAVRYWARGTTTTGTTKTNDKNKSSLPFEMTIE